jgi:hypothetical protein
VNFDDAPEDAAWRAECAAWIEEHLAKLDDSDTIPWRDIPRTAR